MQYQTLRSASDIHLHLIRREGEFEQLPDYIRRQAVAGDVKRRNRQLEAQLSARLARYGFVMEHSELAMFNPED